MPGDKKKRLGRVDEMVEGVNGGIRQGTVHIDK